jgi:hypothetical protein
MTTSNIFAKMHSATKFKELIYVTLKIFSIQFNTLNGDESFF